MPPPNWYWPLGLIPNSDVSRFTRTSPPALKLCLPRVHVKFWRNCTDCRTTPDRSGGGVERLVQAVAESHAGIRAIERGKSGVARVKLIEDCMVEVADGVRV